MNSGPSFQSESQKDDITAIVSVKNRCDYRLVNALKSIRLQDYDQKLIRIVVVDYESKKDLILRYMKICKRFDAEYLRIENTGIWCKGHALNVAIKRAETKYILSTDVDMVFEGNYISKGIGELRKDPRQILISKFWCSQKGDITGMVDVAKDYPMLKKASKLVSSEFGDLNPGINMGLARFYREIRGYDESYKLWGFEDNDLVKRFGLLGLKVKDISGEASFIHQWHPMFEGLEGHDHQKQRMKNLEYFRKNNSIKRNPEGWGKIPE